VRRRILFNEVGLVSGGLPLVIVRYASFAAGYGLKNAWSRSTLKRVRSAGCAKAAGTTCALRLGLTSGKPKRLTGGAGPSPECTLPIH